MAGYSMFETLMSLPLFKGASVEQISAFVEKTHLAFKTYNPGETIASGKDSCRTLRCLISGEMRVAHPMFSEGIIVNETVSAGRFIGAERLFGLDNHLGFKARALTRCGTMELPKSQYMTLLQSNQIFLMNCLNYLARSAQKGFSVLAEADPGSLASLLAHMINVTTTHESRDISVESVNCPVKEFFSGILHDAESQLDVLESEGVVSMADYRQLLVPSRERLMEFVEK